ncbi:MAG: TIGR00153 family protein [Deltaproteobacteria bacterium]|nr:TIGR00153 family protein [Deltaproteobacteria bacterium]
MRIPFMKMFVTSPFEGLLEHAEKVKECAWAFQQAMECHLSDRCKSWEKFQKEVITLEHEADVIKRRIRGHLPKGTLLPVDKFQLFRYLREQDKVLDAVKHTLEWLSYRPDPGVPKELEKEYALLVDAVIAPIEELALMVAEARTYFNTFQEPQRVKVKEIIRKLREMEHEADQLEAELNRKLFAICPADPITVIHMVRLVETTGEIADHAENAGDMMRAMLAK